MTVLSAETISTISKIQQLENAIISLQMELDIPEEDEMNQSTEALSSAYDLLEDCRYALAELWSSAAVSLG